MKALSVYRVVAVLLLGILLVVALHYGRAFLVPLAFAVILSMLLRPVGNKLEGWGLGRIASTLICLLLVLGLVAGFVGIIYAQVVSLSNDWPRIQPRLEAGLTTAQAWVTQQFGMAPEQQIQALKDGASTLAQSSGGGVLAFFGGVTGFLTNLALVLLYLFFLLWQREKYRTFFLKLSSAENRPVMGETLDKITEVSAQYLVGRLISMAVLAVMYGVGLSVVGLDDAILVSLVAVLPTLIPFVGAFIGGIFPLFMALVSGSGDLLLPTLAVLVVAQLIESNVVEPMVLSAKLHLSPIFTIVAIVAGELIWGVPGMILFEPLFAVIKIVCDHVPALHPYGFLLGEESKEPGWLKKAGSLLNRLKR